MPTQSQLVNANAIFPFDGYVVQIGDTEGTLASIGACDGDAAGEMAYTLQRIQDSGGEVILDQIKNPTINLSFSLMEFNADKLEEVGGGLFTKVVTAGTPVTNFQQDLAADATAVDTFYKFSQQSFVGAPTTPVVPTNITVTEDPSGTPVVYVLNTDYIVNQDANGDWGVTSLGAGQWDVTKLIQLEYDYTPRASVALTSGSTSVELTPKIVRFLHTDSAGKDRMLTVYSANLGDGGFTFGFGSALNDGVNVAPITMVGKLDESRANNAQLFTYFDEQQVT